MTGLQPNVFAAISITWAAALTALVLRVVARRMTKMAWWFDDYFCVSAFVFASGYNTILLIWTIDWGLGQFVDPSLSEAQREHQLLHSRLLMYCSQFCYAFSIASSKFAILGLYWRLFKLSSIRIPIQIMFVISLIWIILRTFMVIFHCIPVQAYWDKSIKNARCEINDAQFFFGTVLTHFVMDVIILVLPTIELSRLHLPLGQKLAVMGLFVIGSIVCLASIFVIIESVRYDVNTTEMSHDVALNFMWGAVELNIAIVSACFPLLRPIFRRILPRSFLSSYGRSHPKSRPINTIRLTTIARSEGKDSEESGSSHQLADTERGLSRTTNVEQTSEGHQVVTPIQLPSSRQTGSGEMGAIYVINDMAIQVQEVKHPTSPL
ncbi:hypothetical protein BGZ61DRAFT_358646 [Ilyonectria robusta]|uniref:uncharacterized protein n=1 Tax=Ilyonectria robusta TaxID=1079257 RepID=UPI001E8EC58B|nr:uncharacterized protein BGZ61DRAFT_358646 [Ilyonectria robusta]KAH8680407.1 hypothetical protein BGZ61DRAFT_358646 [Ilyonectria robusta]